MGRMVYITTEEAQELMSSKWLCEHLTDNWKHFCDMADFTKSVIDSNYGYSEVDQFDYIELDFRKNDENLRGLVHTKGLNYDRIIKIYVRAVYNSNYSTKSKDIKCKK